MTLSYKICRYLWEKQWISPSKGRILYKLMARKGPAPAYPFEIDFFGLTYRGDLSNSIDFHVYYYGAFEKPVLFFLRDVMKAACPHGGVFLDIGANSGQHSIFMARHAKEVHAFEPYDVVRKQFERHVVTNHLKNVRIYPVGMSNENRSTSFYAPTGRNYGIGSFDSDSAAKGNRYYRELEVVIGDEYLYAHKITQVDLIKIDVEGFEKLVIQGLRKTLMNHQPIVLMEVSYGHKLSFHGEEDLIRAFPPNYIFYNFDTRKKDGSKARRRESKARRSGRYTLVPLRFGTDGSQDDVVACPADKVSSLPCLTARRAGRTASKE
jgi:FkbM family methyltransferase